MNIAFFELLLFSPGLFAREQKKKSGSFSNRRKCDEIGIQPPFFSFLFWSATNELSMTGEKSEQYEVVIKVSLPSD